MKQNNRLFDSGLLTSIVFYIGLAIILWPYFQYKINPDAISYMSIAQKYIQHDFANAINAYWGPLFSWLLIPFMLVGIKPLAAAKIILILSGLINIIQANILIKLFEIKGVLKNVLLCLIAFILISYAYIITTPDLLFLCLALAYINTILDPKYLNNKYSGIVCGLIGVGLYLVKSYGLPFFIANFFMINLIFYFRSKDHQVRAKVLANFLSGMLVFILISACWIGLISNKYGMLTFSTAANYNHDFRAPGIVGHPMIYMGLFDPPNSTAINIWEDASYLKLKTWSAFDSLSAFKYQIRLIIGNIHRTIELFNEFSFLFLGFLILGIVYIWEKGKQAINDNMFFLILSLGILVFGYVLLVIESRYIWLSNIMILIIAGKLFDLLFKNIRLKKESKLFLIIMLVASFSLDPILLLRYHFNFGKDIYNLNKKLSSLHIKGRMASNKEWYKSLYLAFHNKWQYYGQKGSIKDTEFESQLKNKQIEYYLVWKPSEENIKLSNQYEDITDCKISELSIYKLR